MLLMFILQLAGLLASCTYCSLHHSFCRIWSFCDARASACAAGDWRQPTVRLPSCLCCVCRAGYAGTSLPRTSGETMETEESAEPMELEIIGTDELAANANEQASAVI